MNCGYEDPKDFYRREDGATYLITKEEALKRGFIKICKKCGEIIYDNELEECDDKNYCIMCQ